MPYLVITRAYPAIVVFGDVAVIVTGADVGWIGIALIVSKISSWSPFDASRSRGTILLGVGVIVLRGISDCLASFVGGSTKLIDSGVVIWSAFKVVI